jgi:hypothetical protein
MGDDGARAMAEAVKVNTTLTTLHISSECYACSMLLMRL